MTDTTSHNLRVIESVCEELEVEKVPGIFNKAKSKSYVKTFTTP